MPGHRGAEPRCFRRCLGVATGDFTAIRRRMARCVFGGSSGLEESNGDLAAAPPRALRHRLSVAPSWATFPRLADAKIQCEPGPAGGRERRWRAAISKIDEVPGMTIACAFTGHGFGISPIGLLAFRASVR